MVDELDAYAARVAAERKRNIALVGIAVCVMVIVGALLVQRFLADTDGQIAAARDAGKVEITEAVIEALPPLVRRPMDVRSEPSGAAIILNGIATRLETPATIDVVENAMNTIVLIKEGYKSEVYNAEADAPAVEMTMTPYEAPEHPEHIVHAAKEEEKELEPVHGRIRVISRSPGQVFEGAEVLWNGRPHPEVTPTILHVQPYEEQHLTVRHIDHLDGVMAVQAIPFYRDADMRDALVELQTRRENAFSALAIRTFPRDARVYLDDEDITGSIITPIAMNRHFVLRVEAPGLETYERAFDAIAGTIDVSVMLRRPVFPDGTFEVQGAPDDSTLYLISRREGDESAVEIGRGGAPLRTIESGPYTLRIASGPFNRRTRTDFDIDIPPEGHLGLQLGVRNDELQILSQSNRKPRGR